MTDLAVLKEVGEELVPVIKVLIGLARRDDDAQDRAAPRAVIQKLRTAVKRANLSTPASLAQRSEAIHAARHAVMTILLEAATNPNVALKRTQMRILEAQATALRSAHGRLLEMAAFENIARLLPDAQITTIEGQLDGAQKEIAHRRKARDILDTVVKVAIVAAKVAAKLA